MREKTYRSICQFCHTNCGIILHVNTNGEISVEGDPEHPVNRGRLCSKAAAIPRIINSKDRLHVPLKKTATGFKRISWDEALQFAAEKLGEIRSKYGPCSLVRCTGAPVSYQCRDGFLEFMGAFGSPNLSGAANLCMVPRMTAFKAVVGSTRPEPDYDNTEMVILWGTNPFESERFSAYAAYDGFKHIMPRLKKGGKPVLCIDPYHTKSAREADEWIPIHPGTDSALGLAMIHTIIHEGLYDKDFVAHYTIGFPELKMHIEAFTPEWAARITGIPAEAITQLAKKYATTKPAAIYEGNGLDMYTNGVDSVRTIAILIALTGNLDVSGGNVFFPYARQSLLPTTAIPVEKRVWYDTFPIFGEVPFTAVKESVLRDEDSRPRAMVVHHSNPVLVQANETRTRRLFEKLDFVMATDIFPTATTELADLVLPVASDFESYGYRAYSSAKGGFFALGRPVVGPVGESRAVFEIEYELAQRMGLDHQYPFSDAASWVAFMVKPSGVDFQRLKDEQIVYATGPVQYRKYADEGFDTASGKVELYSTLFGSKGQDPIPFFHNPAGEPLTPETPSSSVYPLTASSFRPGQFVHTKLKNIPELSNSYPEPLIHMHPHDAAERGIEEGDMVAVASPQGNAAFRAMLTRDTQPGLVWIDFGWGNATDGKANINLLTNDRYFDPVSGGTPNRLFRCEVKKAL
jgi:anaerobic selenocysteine-containing dehydrogenase